MKNLKKLRNVQVLNKESQLKVTGGWNCQPQDNSYCNTTCIGNGFFSVKYCQCICDDLTP